MFHLKIWEIKEQITKLRIECVYKHLRGIVYVLLAVGRDSRANTVESSVEAGSALDKGNKSSSLSPRGMATTPSSGT
jgi:hypothetical protein